MILTDLDTRDATVALVEGATDIAVYAAVATIAAMGNTYATTLDAVDAVLDDTCDAVEDR